MSYRMERQFQIKQKVDIWVVVKVWKKLSEPT
jgi:hypothetical protein